MKPLILTPIPERTIWGSNNLSQRRNHKDNYGTWWEVSAHPYCTNSIENIDTHPTLQELIDQNPEELLGPALEQNDILRLAYLDAKEDLSIQVHPDDEYAQKYANDNGKTESWYILDCKEGATLIAGTLTDSIDTLKSSIENHTLKNYLQTWTMHPGDFIVIPAGTLHSLGKDILALEIGTNSNVTYRFYDYNRKDKDGKLRQLHLKESFDVLQTKNQPLYIPAQNKSHLLCDLDYYRVEEIFTSEDIELYNKESYFIVTNIEPKDTTIVWKEETIILPAYGSAFIPYSAQKITLPKHSHILWSQPKRRRK